MPDATYLFMLHEVPIVMGTVQPGRLFVLGSSETLQGTGLPPERIFAATDPASGSPGAWVDAEEQARLEEAGLPALLEPHAFIVRHLETLLKRNLADFLDVQQVQGLLEEWGKEQDEEGTAVIQRALPDDTARLRFGRLLRALAAERVSVARWRDILAVVARKGLRCDDVSGLLVDVRLKLSGMLAESLSGSSFLDFPATIEESLQPWLFREDGRTFLAIPPEETQQALTDIRELVRPHQNANLVLVTKNRELRLFIRRLVELEFPNLVVLSAEELEASRSNWRVPRQGAHAVSASSTMG